MKARISVALAATLLSGYALADCPVGTTSVSDKVCRLQGTYTSDLTLTSANSYLLSGGVFIGGDNVNSARLIIQPGTTVKGQSGRDFLVINRGSQLIADGRKDAPIVFTSDRKVRGGWGGLILNGNAPINGCSAGVCEAEGEGSTGKYGGPFADDSSGIMRFVRVEYSGFQITPENELNGIAFQGVGAGTTVENVQVHQTADDGVEFFGGTVNVRNLVVTGARDDSIDWVNGWTGKIQFAIVKQYDDEANNGIEADNLSSDNLAQPQSLPELSNLTLLGTSAGAAKGGAGILLRAGTGARIYNSIVSGFKSSCLDIDDRATFNQAKIGMAGNVILCAKNFDEEAGDPFKVSEWYLSGEGNVLKDPVLNGVVSAQARTLTTPALPEDLFFDEVDFVGAVRSSSENWTSGWTVGL
jgi:hypothetical protein